MARLWGDGRAGLWLAACVAALACRARAPAAVPAEGGLGLGEIAGFAAGPVERGSAYVRRSYARGGEDVTVTLARFPMSDAQYEDWLRSSAGFPQAELGLAAAEGNGFFECAPDHSDRCNLLIQLRCGLHFEIRGSPTPRKASAEAVAAGLGLRRTADSCAGP